MCEGWPGPTAVSALTETNRTTWERETTGRYRYMVAASSQTDLLRAAQIRALLLSNRRDGIHDLSSTCGVAFLPHFGDIVTHWTSTSKAPRRSSQMSQPPHLVTLRPCQPKKPPSPTLHSSPDPLPYPTLCHSHFCRPDPFPSASLLSTFSLDPLDRLPPVLPPLFACC